MDPVHMPYRSHYLEQASVQAVTVWEALALVVALDLVVALELVAA